MSANPVSRRPRYRRGPIPGRSWRFSLGDSLEFQECEFEEMYALQRYCGKPISSFGYLRVITPREHRIPIHALAIDSAQDLLLLVNYHVELGNAAEGIKVYPVCLSDPVNHGLSRAHRYAKEAVISMNWEDYDFSPDSDNDPDVKVYICGHLYALHIRYTVDWRVVIFNWRTGKQVARVDSWNELSDAGSIHARWNPPPKDEGGPHKVVQFAWLAPDAFMIGNCGAYGSGSAGNDQNGRGLWLYRLDEQGRQPLYQCVALELPRWRVGNGFHLYNRSMTVHHNPWSEDVYPGALSTNVSKRVFVMSEMGIDCGYELVYVFRNDYLLDLLAHHNGRTHRWDSWSPRCSRVFEVRKLRQLMVCGWAVLLCYDNPLGHYCIEVINFNPDVVQSGMAPGVLCSQPLVVVAPSHSRPFLPFEHGIRSEHPFFSTRIEHLPGISGPHTKFMMFADRVLYSNDKWASAATFYFQAAPAVVSPGVTLNR